MALPRICERALLADGRTAALLGHDGSVDRLCLRSGAAAPALLLGSGGRRWRIAPSASVLARRRRYRARSLVLETDLDTTEGTLRLVDFVPPRAAAPAIVRLVMGVRGRVAVLMELRAGSGAGLRPRLRHPEAAGGAAVAGAGGGDLELRTAFAVTAGELVPFVLAWHPPHEDAPPPLDPLRALADTETWWAERQRQAHRGA